MRTLLILMAAIASLIAHAALPESQVVCQGQGPRGEQVDLVIVEEESKELIAVVNMTGLDSSSRMRTYRGISYRGGRHQYYYESRELLLHMKEFAELQDPGATTNSVLSKALDSRVPLLCCALNSVTYPLDRCDF